MARPMVIRFASTGSTIVLSSFDAPMTVEPEPVAPAAPVPAEPIVAIEPVRAASVPVELAEAWGRVLHDWESRALHDIVLGLAAKHEQLAWLAARYREIAKSRPEDPVPPARLARVQRAAVVAFRIDVRTPATRERTPYRGAGIILIAAVVAAVVGLRLVDMKAREHRSAPQVTSPTTR